VQQKKRERPSPPQTTKKAPFQIINRKRTTRVRLVTRPTSRPRVVVYIFNNTLQRKEAPWPQRGRERESTLTVTHTCHRSRIPGGHVLIERRCFMKHCKKREGCNKEKIEPNPPHKQQQQSPVSNHKNKTKRVRLVTRRTSSCRTCIYI